jgi:hypothetical protein
MCIWIWNFNIIKMHGIYVKKVIISLYHWCKQHLHRCFPLVPSSGEQFHLKTLLKCFVLFEYLWQLEHFCNCCTPPKVSLLWRSGGACVVKWSWELCWHYWYGIMCQMGQRWWPTLKGIPWSPRLGVGREADSLTP